MEFLQLLQYASSLVQMIVFILRLLPITCFFVLFYLLIVGINVLEG